MNINQTNNCYIIIEDPNKKFNKITRDDDANLILHLAINFILIKNYSTIN